MGRSLKKRKIEQEFSISDDSLLGKIILEKNAENPRLKYLIHRVEQIKNNSIENLDNLINKAKKLENTKDNNDIIKKAESVLEKIKSINVTNKNAVKQLLDYDYNTSCMLFKMME